MNRAEKLRLPILVAVILSIVVNVNPGLAKQKIKKPIPKGTPVLWRRPADISSRDLYLGPGGVAMRPEQGTRWLRTRVGSKDWK